MSKIVDALLEEHKRASDLFVKYNTPGTGAPAFAIATHQRLVEIERVLFDLETAGRAQRSSAD